MNFSWPHTGRFARLDLTSYEEAEETIPTHLGRARFSFKLLPGAPTTTEALEVAPLFDALPNLRRHACDNGRHLSFADEARNTELAHLFEHLVVECLATDGVAREQAQGRTGWVRTDTDPRSFILEIAGFRSRTHLEEIIEKALGFLDSLDERL